MTNFEILKEECENYWENHGEEDLSARVNFSEEDYDTMPLTWGSTSYQSFLEIVLQVKKPKRFIVFGCSIGYQCFYWNHIFPDIPCIGIDLMRNRVDWGKKMISKYLINNVSLICDDISNFQIQDGDLIWQNNLLFNDKEISIFSEEILKNYDVEIISYKSLKIIESIFDNDDFEIIDKFGQFKLIKSKKMQAVCSWTDNQTIVYYYRYTDNFQFDVDFVLPEFRIPEKSLKDYTSMNFSKRFVKSEELRLLYNKYNNKLKFIEFGFDVPELYFYTKDKCDLVPILSNLKTFVVKPAHFSESVDVFIKKNINQEVDYGYVNTKLNERIDISDKGNWRRKPIGMDINWKDTERGIIVEEYINVIYELKVFVIFGEPVIADLRTGHLELHTVNFIKKENSYLNWNKEYELIKSFAESLKIDFFRIDFLYDGNKLYASELTFMPATYLPESIEELLANKLRMPYLKFYYPQFC